MDASSEKKRIFEESIIEFVPKDGISPPEKKNRKGLISIPKLLVILLCASVFLYCMSELIAINQSNKESSDKYGNLQNDFAGIIAEALTQSAMKLPTQSNILSSSASTPSKGNEFNVIENPQTSQKFQQALSKLEQLNTQNSDIVGYINVSGTAISYPVLQCENNDFYLDHTFDKTISKSGSIFYDFRCNPDPGRNKNLIVYGHNWSNGTMFHNMRYFVDNKELFDQGVITIYSFEGIYTYKIFSVYYVDAYDDYLRINFAHDADYTEWLERRVELSIFKTDVTITPESRIVSLSTCVNGTSDGRIAIHGILTNVER